VKQGSRIRAESKTWTLVPPSVLQEHVCGAAEGARGDRGKEEEAEVPHLWRFSYMRREAPREGHAHLALTLPPAPRAPQDPSRRAAAPAEP